MNGVHDLGGMHGFGPVVRDGADPRAPVPFHADSAARIRVLVGLARDHGRYNIDAFRYAIERMHPADYLRASYYERWLTAATTLLIEGGYVTADELDARTELLQSQPDTPWPPPDAGSGQTPAPAPDLPLPHVSPRFAAGAAVLTRNVHPAGHTRLPRYARGKRGVIHLVHGPAVFADTNAQGLGRNPQVVYNVRFDGQELWGESAEPGTMVSIDLWESYLTPVPG